MTCRRLDLRGIGLSVIFALVLCIHAPSTCKGEENSPDATEKQTLSLGETMYRKGILPSGASIKTAISADVQTPGTTFACAGCHTRSGMGFREKWNQTPAINAATLFQPQYAYFPSLRPSERTAILPMKYQTPPLREAYTDATLEVALQAGIKPDGRPLKSTMPRYRLSENDLKVLLYYLHHLSAEPSPGVTETTITFATVVTDEVSPEDREAMLKVLEQNVRNHNNLGNNPGDMIVMINMRVMRLGYRAWKLALWDLKGLPATWADQLEEYYRKEPVFAVVGGLAHGSWEPVHRFCESRRIPCILPLTDLPVISSTDYYTLYFSKGYYQEGEAAARYLNNNAESGHSGDILQIVGPGSGAEALARGFEETWRGTAKKPVETITLKDGAPLDGRQLAELMQKGKNRDVLLWTGPESYEALNAVAASPDKPDTILMSSSLLGGRLWDLPPNAREFTLVTYPWRVPGEKKVIPPMGVLPRIVNKEFRKNDRRIDSRTNTALDILSSAFSAMDRNFYRDFLLDLIDQGDDLNTTDYEQLAFEPGRRYMSEGCYIMQMSKDPEPALIPKSEWVQH